ncbi:MAG: integrase core domain-containing protein [Spirochaetaceae bacterium]|nr:integrase core domain-containing protein [Spirochaetaceae bacterium]
MRPKGLSALCPTDAAFCPTDGAFCLPDAAFCLPDGAFCLPDGAFCLTDDSFCRPDGAFPVHYSGRGCQYCPRRYVEKLTARGLPASMTGERHCYENVRAERLNGILKQEYSLGCSFRSKKQALAAVDEAVSRYNTRRPRLSLGCETPEAAHQRAA